MPVGGQERRERPEVPTMIEELLIAVGIIGLSMAVWAIVVLLIEAVGL